MKLSRRELVLTGATLVVVLGGASVWIGEPLLKQWDEAGHARVRLENDRKEAEHIIAQRAEWEQKLAALRDKIPQHGENEQVTAGLLRQIRQLADANRINISQQQPDDEKDLGDGLREVAIDCQWDSDLEGLVHFLYAVQMQGAVLDIRQLNVQPAAQGVAGRLRGTFTIFNAFSRGAPKPAQPEEAAQPPPPAS